MTAKVDNVSAEVSALRAEWEVIEPLMAGTLAMRAASEKLLPKWPNEEPESYKTRLAVATLFPAFQRTVAVMAGKPFSKQLTLGKDVPARLAGFADDIDMQGTNLHAFCAGLMNEVVAYGLCGILVDAPKQPVTGAATPPTLADQQANGVRPYFVRVNHNHIIGWRITSSNGAAQLTQLRFREDQTIPDGEYGEVQVERIRVLEPGRWEVQQKDASTKEWKVVEFGNTGLDVIPFAPLYGLRKSLMVGAPPLAPLAHLNVKHWQSQSDQDTILHVARVPILAMAGADEDTALVVGASSAVKLPQGATLEFVEHTGAAIEAGQKSLEALEDQMIQTGAELLVSKPGQRTATEDANDAEGNKSDLQRITEGFEDGLDLAMYFMALFVGETTGGHVSLFKDFGAATLSDASAQVVLTMQQNGLIRKETALAEMQRRGVLSADIDPVKEPTLAAEEAPPTDGNQGNGDPTAGA